MDDSDILARIREMVDAEHELRRQMQDNPGQVSDAAERLRGGTRAVILWRERSTSCRSDQTIHRNGVVIWVSAYEWICAAW